MTVTTMPQDWIAERERLHMLQADHARFYDFARAAADWFWEVDSDLRIIALSEGGAAAVGKPMALLIGQMIDCLGLLHEDADGERPIMRARSERAAFGDQLLTCASGQVVRLAGFPVFDAGGAFIGFRGMTSLVKQESPSLTGDIARRGFLSAMRHELRTPLNAIIGFAEAINIQLFGPINPHYVDYARDIASAGRHLLGLIEDLLDVSVIEAGDVQLAVEPLDASGIAERAHSLVALRAAAKRIDLMPVVHDRPSRILGDERRVLQILVNLLTNAVKFTPEGGQVGVRIVASNDGRTTDIIVWDTGPGIAPVDQARVFDKFQQLAEGVYAGRPEGAGLGLHISRELACLMRGDIHIDSAVGQGARFILRLPTG